MRISRRQFVGYSALAALSGCARVKQSRIGQLTPEFEFGGDGIAKVAAIGDLHIVDSRSVGIVGRAVNRINNDPDIDFVAVLGDLTDNGALPQMNLALQALERLEKPYYCVPGEHDVDTGADDPNAIFRRTFGKAQWRMNTEGWGFIGLDTTGDDSPAVAPDRLEWLEGQLRHTNRDKPLALMSHHPLNPDSKGEPVANAEAVLALFADHNLRLVASGHYHGNQAEERDGILFTTTAACSSAVDNDDGAEAKGYRVFTLAGPDIEHEFVAVT